MELWVATSNKGKIEEIKQILMETSLEIHSANELSVYTNPAETGKTFEENARIKAKSLAALTGGLLFLFSTFAYCKKYKNLKSTKIC